jgi:S-adenosylmethionine:tRNA ribosyltransferase-isomerase
MKTSDFNYDLPEDLIAKYPLNDRTDSRLLVFNDKEIKHEKFSNLLDYLQPNDLLVMNESAVIPARLIGEKETGGKVEVMLERFLSSTQTLVQIKSSRSPTKNSNIFFTFSEETITATVKGRQDNFFILDWKDAAEEIFQENAIIPLPPYIDRDADHLDEIRYQTVYANMNKQLSVAAPTAGLHFDNLLLTKIKNAGINTATLNLHVGSGTFTPVKHENIQDHKIHYEKIEVSEDIISKIKETKENKGRVIAVGTTSVRALETAFQKVPEKYNGETNLFIYPGYEFKVIDLMITNFHLPKSSLLMLVSAFIGHQEMHQIYQTAVTKRYRFLSYGDAMLLTKK